MFSSAPHRRKIGGAVPSLVIPFEQSVLNQIVSLTACALLSSLV